MDYKCIHIHYKCTNINYVIIRNIYLILSFICIVTLNQKYMTPTEIHDYRFLVLLEKQLNGWTNCVCVQLWLEVPWRGYTGWDSSISTGDAVMTRAQSTLLLETKFPCEVMRLYLSLSCLQCHITTERTLIPLCYSSGWSNSWMSLP